MAYKLSLAEMETTINFDRSSETANIYTTDPVMMRKLDKLARETPILQAKKIDEYSREYECPKSMIKIHKPRLYTGEKRKELSDRMKAARERRVDDGADL